LELPCFLCARSADARGFLRIELESETITATFNSGNPAFHFKLNAGGTRWRQWFGFISEGIWHIWSGYDHILFLIALLCPLSCAGNRALGTARRHFGPHS